MATILQKTDVVVIGLGWAGSIVANECAKAGLKVVGLERGNSRKVEDFLGSHDEYKAMNKHHTKWDLSKETVTFTHDYKIRALPMRRMSALFDAGSGLGGAGMHWSAHTYRFLPYDFEIKSQTEARYGQDKIKQDYFVQDWGISYDEIEPYYDKFEKMVGCAGEDKNPFGGKRSSPYPNPPIQRTPYIQKFIDASEKLGYHPLMTPASICTQSYTNPDKQQLEPCQFCAFCSSYGCEYNSKASPLITTLPSALATGNFEIKVNANVLEIMHENGKATGVRFVHTKTLQEFILPADVVILAGFVFSNSKLLLTSRIGAPYDPQSATGVVGKNLGYQMLPSANIFFEEPYNSFLGAGSLGATIDDFNGDNFDHSSLDFIHGGGIFTAQMGETPITFNPLKGYASYGWGKKFKQESIYNFTRTARVGSQGASLGYRYNYISLDENYKDAYGMPLAKVVYNYTEQDKKLYDYQLPVIEQIVKEMGAKEYYLSKPLGDFNVDGVGGIWWLSNHFTGGTPIGHDPKESVVNPYLQHWDMDNLFVVGASVFPHNSGYNPTNTLGALAFKASEGVIKYFQTARQLG